MSRLADFLAARAGEAYPEPRTEGHDSITAKAAALVADRLAPGASVLDIGCGQGPALEWFSKAGFDVTGTTINDDDFKACEDAGYRVERCDMHDTGEYFNLERFDFVLARHVLEHSVAPFFTLHEFARVLKPGGILYAEMPAPDTACCHQNNPNHYSVLGASAWASLIHRAGFAEVELREITLKTDAGPDLYFSFIATKP
jgi:SAM-dependent methyltransferase